MVFCVLNNILINPEDFPEESLEEQGQLDELEPKMITCPHCNKEFDRRIYA